MPSPMPPPPLTSLGRHAHAVYGRPSAREVCLEAQDGHGADVVLILAFHHAAATGRRLDAHGIAALDAAAAGWRAEIVRPLRALRRRLRGAAPGMAGMAADRARTIGDGVLGLEIAAETAMLDALAPALDGLARPLASGEDGRTAFARMLDLYGQLLVARPEGWARVRDGLVASIGPAIPRGETEDRA
ncbi:TIGR02444 family protein [Tistrella mobilis]|uniref:TIGR02444 family protein n=1 Tax=Tistrella mobilis TaxID=171437 RepID=UPI0035572620